MTLFPSSSSTICPSRSTCAHKRRRPTSSKVWLAVNATVEPGISPLLVQETVPTVVEIGTAALSAYQSTSNVLAAGASPWFITVTPSVNGAPSVGTEGVTTIEGTSRSGSPTVTVTGPVRLLLSLFSATTSIRSACAQRVWSPAV